jgi:Protein of unknown function (DUF2845)
MRYRPAAVGLITGFCLGGAQHAWADTLRCGDKVIAAGESMVTVRASCGPPTLVERSVEVSATTTRSGDQSHTVGGAVPVEVWTYDRGPSMLMVSIRFVDGKVVAVTTLHDYGH